MSIEYQTIEKNHLDIIHLHGEKIYDYYKWLEKKSVRKKEILQVEADTLEKYLNLNTQENDWVEIRKIFHSPIDYELYSDVQYINGFIFYTYRNFSKSIYRPIFKRVKSMRDKNPHVVFDSNKIERSSVIEHEYSPNGKHCVFTISVKDRIANKAMLIDVETGETYNSLELHCFEKIAWSGDSKGFFIYHDPERKKKRDLYYHFVNEYQYDKLIAKIREEDDDIVSFKVSHDYKYLILFDSQALSIANIESLDEDIKFKRIFKINENISYEYVGNNGEFFTFLKNIGAPKHDLVEIDLRSKRLRSKRPARYIDVVVAENFGDHGVLKTAFAFSSNAFILLVYIESSQSSIYVYSLISNLIEYKIELIDEQFVSSKVDKFGFFFETRSFKTQRKVYRIDLSQLVYRDAKLANYYHIFNDRNQFRAESPHKSYSTLKPLLWKESNIPNLDGIEIDVQHDSFKSFDNTEVPMTIIKKKGGNDDKKRPCLCYAYGGYGDSILPRFDLYFLLFIELFDAIVVFIHIRGGGELGDVWSLKSSEIQTSFKDLISGIWYLKGETYSNIIDSNKIAFHGTSHGGLVGAAIMNISPNLLRAVTILNGYFDLINDLLTGDRLNQYGNINIKDNFKYIKRYAPLLHLYNPTKSEDSYPTTLIVVSKKDEEVPFEQSLKYLAHRREVSVDNEFQRDKPTLLKVIQSGGHNYRTALKKEYIDTVFVKLQFLAEAMQLKFDDQYQSNVQTRVDVEENLP
ncbi:prolyl endopeptidase-like [Contarinia nasturtii]|uniref:prolyl endopeptidase-like n=1 Tax=Contarinia nasturtii TaxID=265458 RepID=UPI0012D4A7BF|nr:prolyl endopeptidase-like [Contarinia nasturtii]